MLLASPSTSEENDNEAEPGHLSSGEVANGTAAWTDPLELLLPARVQSGNGGASSFEQMLQSEVLELFICSSCTSLDASRVYFAQPACVDMCVVATCRETHNMMPISCTVQAFPLSNATPQTLHSATGPTVQVCMPLQVTSERICLH